MLRIAFATTNGVAVDEHFGRCTRFDVYELTRENQAFVESRLLQSDIDQETEIGKLDDRIRVIQDCAIVYLTAIGGGAAARVTHSRIHPMKVDEGSSIDSLLLRFRALLAGTPPPWLRRLLATGAEAL